MSPRQLGEPIYDDPENDYPVEPSPEIEREVPDFTPPPPPAEVHSDDASLPAPAPVKPSYAGGEAPGQITATPRQATVDLLNLSQRQQDIANAGGNNDLETGQLIAAKSNEAANEKVQQAADYQQFLNQNITNLNQKSNQAQQAYNAYKAQAGSLKNPSEEYWGGKGVGVRVLSGLAAFASGMGAGLLGKGGNPYLDYLNKQIEDNFNAHKQNIDDLYKAQVAAGSLVDNAQTKAKFEQQAKLVHYELASAHIIPELEGIKANATGQAQRLLADKTITDLQGQDVGLKQSLAHNEAMQQAAYLAAQRQRQKEVRESFKEALDRHKDIGNEEQQRAEAFKDLQGMGYNRSDIAGIASGLNYPYNPNTGRFEAPNAPAPGSSASEPELDEKGQLIVPSVDQNGHRIKPEEQQKLKEEWSKRVVVDTDTGKKRLVVNEKYIPTYIEHSEAYAEAQRLTTKLENAWNAGDSGAYRQARLALIELVPKVYGYTRGPSGAQAGERSAEGSTESATVAGQLPEDVPLLSKVWAGNQQGHAMINSELGMGREKIAGWKEHLAGIHQSVNNTVFGPSTAAPAGSGYIPGFKPTPKAEPVRKGPPPAPIPNIRGTTGAQTPGVPSWQDYNRNK